MIDPGQLDRRITLLKLGVSDANIAEVTSGFTSRVSNDFGEIQSLDCVTDEIEALGGKEQSSFGEQTRQYTTLTQVWAKVEYKGTPKEGEDTEKLTSINKVRFTIRYRSDVDATNKISWGGKTYEIEGVSLEGRECYLIIDTRLTD